MANLITFYDASQSVAPEYFPEPALRNLPEWYKRTNGFDGDKIVNRIERPQDVTSATIKRCVPVLDAIGAGYLIKLHVDIMIRVVNGQQIFQWASGEPMGWHAPFQAANYPGQENRKHDYAKFRSPWSIETPSGYSTLFLSPIHRGLPFHTLEGMVDTDTYRPPVEFPIVFHNPLWEGLIEAGTPIAQVVPVKRERWEMRIGDSDSYAETVATHRKSLTSVFINAYRHKFWQRKEYR